MERIRGLPSRAAAGLSLLCTLVAYSSPAADPGCVGPAPSLPAAAARPSLPTALLQLQVLDAQAQPLSARVSLRDGFGLPVPGVPDTALHTHHGGSWMGEYFYVEGSSGLSVPLGPITVAASHGFEWIPHSSNALIQGDTTLTIVLERLADLGNDGWVPGDVHVHTAHPPLRMDCTTRHLQRIATAEALGIAWALDGPVEFSGGPHALSTPETILYFSTEWRNQAYGHAGLLGLTNLSLGYGCCAAPAPAHPMLSMLREQWSPDSTQALVLAHPRNGAGFLDDAGWPGWGLGRELPVLAARGELDAIEVGSYSTSNEVSTADWQGLLSCGILAPPAAGSDAVLSWYQTRPPGGYRIYVREDGPHSAASWVSGLRAGRVFVTNYPLIPLFTVDGAEAGSRIDRPGPTTSVEVRIRVVSTLPPSTVTLLCNGQPMRTWQISDPELQTWEFVQQFTLGESCWLSARVDGTTDSRQAVSPLLFAQTGAVFVRLDGEDPRSTFHAGRFIDWVDSLETFVETCGNWPGEEEREEVLGRLQAARVFFGLSFRVPPRAFNLIAPQNGDTLLASDPIHFDWANAPDPEAGDKVAYTLELSADTTFAHPRILVSLEVSEADVSPILIPPGGVTFWRVFAVDRGDNATLSTPSSQKFFLRLGPSAAEDPPPARLGPLRLGVRPNPTSRSVRFVVSGDESASGGGPPAHWPGGQIDIFDPSGRLIRSVLVARDSEPSWDGRDDVGRPVPSGVYLARLRDERRGESGQEDESELSVAAILVLH